MENRDKAISELLERLDQLTRQQKHFQDEIRRIREDLHKLTLKEAEGFRFQDLPTATRKPPEENERFVSSQSVSSQASTPSSAKVGNSRTAWEEFIGTNLLNKVGIAILVLGIGFGAKYSIDHGILDAQTRIVLGYVSGLMLIAIGYRLRQAHTAFSAVLLSGGIAVLYFITFLAYSFYDLIPQVTAFMLMVVFTGLTVLAAMRYNYESIGIIGLVGAYAVPLLLSDGSGRVIILFTYISIINMGILFLSFRRHWKGLYYSAFILTWLTFASWYALSYRPNEHAEISLIFSTVFFLTFYATFLAYKVIRRQALGKWDIVSMLFNSFIFFGWGYVTVESMEGGEEYLGLFTLVTALMHFVACLFIYRTGARFSDSFYFVAGMVLVFVTIAVPVQFEGSWVTLVWTFESILLLWIGRTKSFPVYEKISYPLMLLAFLSLMHDWGEGYPPMHGYTLQEYADSTIFLNIRFVTSMIVGIAFISILLLRYRFPATPVFVKRPALNQIISTGLPIVTVLILYLGAFKEIQGFWNNEYVQSRIVLKGSEGSEYYRYNESLIRFKEIWLIIYSALFTIAFSVVQGRWRTIASVSAGIIMMVFTVVAFLTTGLIALDSLRSDYLTQQAADVYVQGSGFIALRYLGILTILPLLYLSRKMMQLAWFNDNGRKGQSLALHFVILVLLSSELIHWFEMARVENSFKLSLSILWGAYALFLVVLGVSRDAKHLRLGAIVLFGATLLKLFVYDMEDMSTILKTVVMMVLGVLLLTASFVYNKYKRSARNEAP